MPIYTIITDMSTPISDSISSNGKRPISDEATPVAPTLPMTRSRKRQVLTIVEPTVQVAPAIGRANDQPMKSVEQGMHQNVNNRDQLWDIVGGMDKAIIRLGREQQRAGQLHEDNMEFTRELNRMVFKAQERLDAMEKIRVEQDRLRTVVEQMGRKIIEFMERTTAAEARATAAEATAAEALGLANAVAAVIQEEEPNEEAPEEEEPEEAPEEDEDDAQSAVSSAHHID